MIVGFLADSQEAASCMFEGLLADEQHAEVGLWRSARAALACGRTQAPGDLSGFPLATGQHAIAAWGRIDNLHELRHGLDLSNTAPAAEVLLACYRRWGGDMATHLLGDFAVAALDEQLGLLHFMRDRLGAAPLFFARTRSGVAFASSIDRLLRLPGVGREPNERRIAEYLTNLPHDPGATFYRDVSSLPPAHVATLTGSTLRVKRYWELASEPELAPGHEDQYVAGFHERFLTAVKRCTVGTDRVGVILSGGLDSSSIACMAGLALGKSLDTFTAVFPGFPACDERAYVEQVVHAVNARPTYLPMTTDVPPRPWDLVGRVSDPTALVWYPVVWPEFALARSRGHAVVLTGALGDLVGGCSLNSLEEFFARRQLLHLARELWMMPREKAVRVLATFAAFALLPKQLQAWRRARARRNVTERFAGLKYVSPELLAKYDLTERAAEAAELEAKRLHTTATKGTVDILRSTLPEGELGVFRWCAETNGVVARHPFADVELLAWSARLPADMRLRSGLSRWALRASMAGLLPDQVRLRRRKTYFDGFYEAVTQMWLKHLRNWLPAAPFVNAGAAMRAAEQPPRGGPELHALWTCGSLLLWLQREVGNG